MKYLTKFITNFAVLAAIFGVGTCSNSLFYQPKVPEKLKNIN